MIGGRGFLSLLTNTEHYGAFGSRRLRRGLEWQVASALWWASRRGHVIKSMKVPSGSDSQQMLDIAVMH